MCRQKTVNKPTFGPLTMQGVRDSDLCTDENQCINFIVSSPYLWLCIHKFNQLWIVKYSSMY